MKVIFVDADVVLNSQQLFEKCEDDQLISVDEDKIKNLKRTYYHHPGDTDGQNTVMLCRTGVRF